VGVGLMARVGGRARRLGDRAYWARQTARVQIGQLRGLVSKASGTEFGRAHDFARLAALPDEQIVAGYRRAVPVADWYAYKDLIARMREGGEPDLLWPGQVRDFAQTSGTTAGDKYIPVSREMLRSNFLAAMDIYAHALRFGISLPRLLGGRMLFLGGSTDLAVNDRGIRTGDLSGIVTPLIRWPLSEVYSPGKTIALMSHWPSKIDAMARLTIDQDVRMLSGMPSWALVLSDRVLELARERDLRSRVPGDSAPATTVRQVWPNLELFVHGGVKYAPFDAKVRQVYSGSARGAGIPHRLELYPASEGFVAIQDTEGDPGLRLNVDLMNFFEFVPLGEIGQPDARAATCYEVEKGQRYVVVLSTCAGLWRYVLGDVVEFDTVPAALDGRGGDGPSRLRIVGRHRHFINAFGENLIVEHIENAVATAARRAGLVVGEFTAAPVYPGNGRRAGLELAIEVEAGQPGAGGQFAAAFDEALKAQNVDYTTKRTDDLGMAPPTITELPPGSFHRWLASKGKLGGQHKCPRCANSREMLEGVVAAAGLAKPT